MDSAMLRVVGRLEEGPSGQVVAREELGSVKRMEFAMSVLDYNQSFVNFTDGKANSLLLINSIFLAMGAVDAMGSKIGIAAVFVSAMAILMCMAVIFARLPGMMRRDRAKLVFFGHVRQRRNKAAYVDDFKAAHASEISESLSGQIYDLAEVVERKFIAYRRAQLVTLLSAGLWIVGLLAPMLDSANV